MILSGLLGGGAFRGNRPLTVLLHYFLHDDDTPLLIHTPIFWSFCVAPTHELEDLVCSRADDLMYALTTQMEEHWEKKGRPTR